jgi:hypothetical protein
MTRRRPPLLFSRLCALLLFCACLIQASALAAGVARDLRPTPVQKAAIESPKTLETCPHHPEGCPANCFCPKTRIEIEEAVAMPPEKTGDLRETSWVHCNDQGSSSTAPAFAVFVGEQAPVAVLPTSTIRTLRVEGVFPTASFTDPPQKIPVG